MTSKTYHAPTMGEALTQIKRDLGRDAVILHTRRCRRSGLMGLCGRRVWEVTASPNVNVPERIPKGDYIPGRLAAAPPAETPAGKRPATVQQPAAPPPADRAGLGDQVRDIRRMIEMLVARGPGEPADAPAVPAELGDLQARLLEQDIAAELAGELIRQLCLNLTGQQLGDRELVRAELRKMMAARIDTQGAGDAESPRREGRARVIALVGPTGVGKTTTVAKLAATYKLHHGKNVALVTIDTYRIAAVDQLRTYAKIIDVPLQAVLSAGELHQAVHAMSGQDVVLIDTAGRSHNNRLRLNQLRSFLAAAEPDEVHLVVSATSNRRCTERIVERFAPLGANRLIVSKLDEAEAFGVLLNVSRAGAGPLSYVTTGQGVPEDIEPADADRLAGCILTGNYREPVHVC